MNARVQKLQIELPPPTGKLWQTAHWISQIVSPPVVGLLTIVLCAAVAARTDAWSWAGWYTLLTVILPTGYVVWLVKRGVVSDFHLPNRQDRFWPLLVTLGCTLSAWVIMVRWQAPKTLNLLAGINGVQTILFFLITLRWKVSLHTAAITGLFVLMVTWLGTAAAGVGICVPVVAWSRVYLGRHTLAQVMGGIALGGGVVLALLGMTGMA